MSLCVSLGVGLSSCWSRDPHDSLVRKEFPNISKEGLEI